MAGADSMHGIYRSLQGILARSVSKIMPPKEIEDIVQETCDRVCQIQNKGEIGEPLTLRQLARLRVRVR